MSPNLALTLMQVQQKQLTFPFGCRLDQLLKRFFH